MTSRFLESGAAGLLRFSLIWWAAQSGNPAIVLGWLVIATAVPLNIGSMLTGRLVQRFGPRQVVLRARAGAACGVAVLALLVLQGWMSSAVILLTVLAVSIMVSPALSAADARLPLLGRLAGVRISTLQGTAAALALIARLIGLGLGGLLVERLGLSVAISISATVLFLPLLLSYPTFPATAWVGDRSIWTCLRNSSAFSGTTGAAP